MHNDSISEIPVNGKTYSVTDREIENSLPFNMPKPKNIKKEPKVLPNLGHPTVNPFGNSFFNFR